jgi:hypothetical protein
MIWSIPLSSFSALATGETSYFLSFIYLWDLGSICGSHMRGKIFLLCNVVGICRISGAYLYHHYSR